MKIIIFIPFLIAAICNSSFAQPSYLDPSFGNDGIVITHYSIGALSIGDFSSVVMQPDQKIVAAGTDAEQMIVIRYLENGTLDSTFGVNGIFSSGYYHTLLNEIILQPDEKIVGLGGILGPGDILLIRLNTDGSLDNTFGTGGIDTIGLGAYVLALQPDGKIIVAGGNATTIGVARFLPDGAPDSSFGVNGLSWPCYGEVHGIAIMPDGRIVVGGLTDTGSFIALRLLSNGALDTSFNHTGITTTLVGDSYDYSHALQLQPDGKIVLGGSGTFGATGSDFVLVRYNTDGSLDGSYGNGGITHVDFNENYDEIWAMYQQPDGKMVAAGYAIITANENFALCRVNTDGSIDSAFGNNGRITTQIQSNNDRALSVTEQLDGKVILGGYATDSTGYRGQMTLARYLTPTVNVNNVIRINNALILYPNPSTGKLNIKGSVSHITSISACDVRGNQISINTSLPTHEIYTDGIADGLYFFKISFDDRPPIVQKIIIQKN